MRKSFQNLQNLLISITFLLIACDIKNEANPGPDTSVPQAAMSAVLAAFPGATSLKFTPIEVNRVWQAKFALDAARMAVYVNSTGRIYEASQDTGSSDLPAALLQYIRKLYPKAIILESAKSIQDGAFIGFKVLIQIDEAVQSETKTLLFDTNGYPSLDVDSGNGTNSPNTVSYVLGLEDLPEAAKTALSGYTFLKGLAETYDGKTTYTVLVTKEGVNTSFVFDATGNVLKSYQEAPITDPSESPELTGDNLPASIKTYLNQNYEGWKFAKGAIDKENGQVKSYLVVFLLVESYYIAEFDAEGKLLKTIQKL